MKINTSSGHFLRKKSDCKDLIKIMKICLLFLFAFTFQLMALNTKAQDAVIELKRSSVTIGQLINEIEKQTDYLVVYSNREVDTNRKVNFQQNSDKVSSYLNIAFSNTNIGYDFENNYIVLSKKTSQNTTAINELLQTAQQKGKTITGKVSDENGEPVIGANIVEKGTMNGTITDNDGYFSLEIDHNHEIIHISYIGYLPQEIFVSGKTKVDIILKEDTKALEEVVVIGYGTQKKINLTGSVASVNFDESMNSRPLTNVSSALSGLVPGLNVRQNSGTPGADNASLTLRGTSLNGGEPYILIDGMPGDLNQISPNDVENISVLKDAASASIYGNKAANGVILITTKSGAANSGKISFDYNGSVGFSKPTNLFDIISNTADHMTIINNILTNSGQGIRYTADQIQEWREGSKTDPIKYPNTNWWNALIKDNTIQTHQFSVRGGKDKVSFYTSANYQYNDGLIPNSSYKSLNFRNNIDYRVNQWLKIGNIMTSFYGENDPARLNEAFTWFMATTPGMVQKAPDGRYGSAQTVGESGANNLLQLIESSHGSKEKRRFTTKFFAEITPFEGLKIDANYFQDFYSYYESYVWDDQPRWNFQTETETWTGMDPSIGLRRQNTESKSESYNFNVFATYSKKMREHAYSGMVGYEQGLGIGKGFYNLRQGVYSVDVPNATAAEDILSGAHNEEDAYQSIFSRVNYSYKDKYLLEVNWRFDGSSRFSKGHRWGNFPSVSFAWRASEEPFWNSVKDKIENLKIRLSYGALGNNNVGLYATREVYNSANTPFGDKIQGGLLPGGFVNDLLTWEKTQVFDLGFDISFLNDFNFTLDFYDKKTLNILTSQPISFNNGTSSGPVINGPKIQNRGIELELAYMKNISPDLGIQIKLNAAYNQNKVLKYEGKDKLISGGGTPYGYIVEGQPIGKFYIMKVENIVQDKATIDAMIADGYRFGLGGIPNPGDFLFADTYGDKRINENDRVLIGRPQPELTFGTTFNINFKNFDVNAVLSGILGWDRYINNQFTSLSAHTVGYLYPSEFLNMYTDENPNAMYPRVYTNNSKNQVSVGSTWHLYSADYLRIKTLQLGYTLPKKIIKKMSIDRLRLYVNLENFFTRTSYPGLDPEIGGDINYPLLKTTSAGLNISF